MLNEREFTRCKISIFPSVYVGRFSSVNVTKPQETADLVTFTEEILIGKLQCLSTFAPNACSDPRLKVVAIGIILLYTHPVFENSKENVYIW